MAKKSALLFICLLVLTGVGGRGQDYPDCLIVGRDVETLEDFPEILTGTWQECSSSCRSIPACNYWVWRTEEWQLCPENRGSKHACYRKVGTDNLVALPCQTDGLLAGHRDCHQSTPTKSTPTSPRHQSTPTSPRHQSTPTKSTPTSPRHQSTPTKSTPTSPRHQSTPTKSNATCQNVGVKVTVKDGSDNTDIENATVSLDLINVEKVSTQVHTNLTGAKGHIIIPIQQNGEYVVRVTSDGYIEDKTTFNVTCDVLNCHLCDPTILISLVPTPLEGEVRILMNWDEYPQILDLHVVQIDTGVSPPTFCHTYYDNKGGCVGLVQDYENVDGGYEGAESVTLRRESQVNRYIYMVFVDDFGQEDDLDAELGGSNVRLSIVSATESIKESMEDVGYNDERYWIAGCFRFSEGELDWKSQHLLATVSPLKQSSNHCLTVYL